MNDEEAARRYAARLPIGERLGLGEVADDDLFPFEGTITTRPLAAPEVPEPPRFGEAEAECWSCTGRIEPGHIIWEDDRWRVLVEPQPHALPMVAILQPKAHVDVLDMPDDLARELGPMIVRVTRAIVGVDGIGRVHVNRWGDGSYHFHVWFLARPYGMRQMRGAMLAVWDDLLPKLPAAEWDVNRRTVAARLAADGGQRRID